MAPKSEFKSASAAWLSPISVAGVVLLVAVLLQIGQVPSLTGPPAPNKPYGSFTQFYPFYMSEHSDKTNRQLHFAGTSLVLLLFALHPRSIPSMLFAAACGFLLCPALIGLKTGLIEFVVLISVFLLAHKASTGKLGVAVLFPLVGYSFAWVGHFMHEHNHPATFTYPAYSLAGDFMMWARICMGQETF